MSRNLARPFFPTPPPEYNQQYFAEFVRAFSLYQEQARNPGEGRHTKLVLTNIATNDAGLEVGTLFVHDGHVKIVLADRPHPAGVNGSGFVGSVTVSTP